MTEPYTGGCACGALRYEIDGEPVFSNHCHCDDCRHTSGTGHASYMTFPSRDKVRVAGVASTFAMTGDSGNRKTKAFCSACGSPVYLTFAAMPDLFTVNAGSLDDPTRFAPQAVTYGKRAREWDRDWGRADEGLPVFDTMPTP